MNAGLLDRRIDILSPPVSVDEFGHVSTPETWPVLATVWASVVPVSSSEAVVADARSTVGRYDVRIRYRSDLAPKFRIRHDTMIFEIDGIEEIDRRVGLLLRCRVVNSEPA